MAHFSKLVQHLGYQLRTARNIGEVNENWRMIIDCLPDAAHTILVRVLNHPGIGSREISRKFGITINNAATVLKMLYDLGMLDRYEVKDPYRRFVYRSARARHEIRVVRQLELPF